MFPLQLKCEGLDSGSKCIRCRQKLLECAIDSEYKRVNKRSRLEDLSDEVRRLRSMLTQPQLLANNNGEQHSTSHVNGQSRSARQPERANDTTQTDGSNCSTSLRTVNTFRDPMFPTDQDVPAHENPSSIHSMPEKQNSSSTSLYHTTISRELDGVYLDAKRITKLFQLFFKFFHPHLPILDETLSPDDHHDRSLLLFWTIIALTARTYTEEPGISSNLVTPLTKLLWAKISGVPHSHLTIQAIVLLCTWPFSVPSMITDPTFMLISIARTGCIHLGLHRPELMQDYNRVRFEIQSSQISEAVKLWVGCFIAAESVTSCDGHEPLYGQSDLTLSQAAKRQNIYQIPENLQHILVIQKLLNRFNLNIVSISHSRAENKSHYEVGTFLASFEDDFRKLEESLHEDMNGISALWFVSAKLQVQTCYFLEPVGSPARKEGLLRAYHTAVDLIKRLRHANMAHYFSNAAPRHFGQMLKHAALVLMKLLHSQYARILNFEEGKRFFNIALDLHRSMTYENNDFHARAVLFLSHTWGILEHSGGKNDLDAILKLDTRYSASLLHESLWIWRDYYEGKPTEQMARPPRTLPSIVQHSPSTSQESPLSTVEINTRQRNVTQQRPANSDDTLSTIGSQQFGPEWVYSSNEDTETNDLGLDFVQHSNMSTFSPNTFDIMNTYLGPDIEATEFFFS